MCTSNPRKFLHLLRPIDALDEQPRRPRILQPTKFVHLSWLDLSMSVPFLAPPTHDDPFTSCERGVIPPEGGWQDDPPPTHDGSFTSLNSRATAGQMVADDPPAHNKILQLLRHSGSSAKC